MGLTIVEFIIHKARFKALPLVAVLLWLPLEATAQTVPPDNTLTQTQTSGFEQQNSTYTDNDPVARFTASVMWMDAQSYAPFDTLLIEVSSAASGILTLDVNTDPACTFSGPPNIERIVECSVAFPLAISDVTSGQTDLTVRYYATKNGAVFYRRTTAHMIGQSLCNPETAPLMPTSTVGGTFIFSIAVADLCNTGFFIDPPVSEGYNYQVNGARFQSVTAPTTVPDPDGYTLEFSIHRMLVRVPLSAGQTYTFQTPPDRFAIVGINPDLSLNPSAPDAFPTGVDLTSPTGPVVTIRQTPLTTEWPPLPGIDGDGDGFTVAQGDCNDASSAINPAATDIPDNGIDENCDGRDSRSVVFPNSPLTPTPPVFLRPSGPILAPRVSPRALPQPQLRALPQTAPRLKQTP